MIRVSRRLPIEELQQVAGDADRVAVITDSNVTGLITTPDLRDLPRIVIPAGEENKNIATCEQVWQELSALGMTRHSLAINVGGGMVTDLGGFCAATYMRGIRSVNISTTLLGAVDASVGGKTGVDLGVLKNRVGVFAEPRATFVPIEALHTLPPIELLSGYGEILKTAYISSERFTDEMLRYKPVPLDEEVTERAVKECLAVKECVVSRDPYERGERKILNFGHTAGHAFEELSMQSGRMPLAHGVAVAHGLLVSLILSHLICRLPTKDVYRYADHLREVFPPFRISCKDYDELLRLMHLDKKNRAGSEVRFVLLRAIGVCEQSVGVSETDIKNALDIYCDLTGQ